MTLDGDHNFEEVFDRDEPCSVLVLGLEGHQGVLLVEVVQELGELGIGDVAFLKNLNFYF